MTTKCGRFRLGPNGRVVYVGTRTLPVPRGTSYWADLTWYRFARGHLLIGQGHQQFWRSRGTYTSSYPGNIGVVVLGARELAFSYFRGRRPHLYLARYGAGEYPLTRGETPLAFLRSGELLTWRDRGGAIVLRAEDGRFERLIVSRSSDPHFDRRSGTLVFRAGDRLRLFDGRRARSLASLSKLGLERQPVIELLGRLVTVRDQHRLVVLRDDGRVFASTKLPRRRRPTDMVSSPVIADQSGTAVAFTATSGNTANGSRGRETVYLLRAGGRRARPLYTERFQFKGCERSADIAWHGSWILYSASENRAAVIDSSLSTHPIELGATVGRLPGIARGDYAGFSASWAH